MTVAVAVNNSMHSVPSGIKDAGGLDVGGGVYICKFRGSQSAVGGAALAEVAGLGDGRERLGI